MKNPSQRSKIILAIAGVLVVVAVAVVAFTQLGGEELFGASLVGVSPSNPIILVGRTVTLSASTSLSNCSWSSANTAVATVASNNKSAVVTGRAPGQAKINVKCGAGLTTGSTTVTVNPAPTATPVPPTRTPGAPPVITVGPDTGKASTELGNYEKMTLCTGDSSVRWDIASQTPAGIVSLAGSSYAPGCALVTAAGSGNGTATIRAINGGGGSATVSVRVDPNLTVNPIYPTISVGQKITLTVYGNQSNADNVWSIARGCEDVQPQFCHVTLVEDTAPNGWAYVTGVIRGSVVITATRPGFPMAATVVTVQ